MPPSDRRLHDQGVGLEKQRPPTKTRVTRSVESDPSPPVAAHAMRTPSARQILHLQRTVGNRVTGHLVSRVTDAEAFGERGQESTSGESRSPGTVAGERGQESTSGREAGSVGETGPTIGLSGEQGSTAEQRGSFGDLGGLMFDPSSLGGLGFGGSSGFGGLGGLMFDPSSLGGLGFGGLGFGSSSFTGSLSTPLYDSSRFGGLPGGGRSFSSWDFDNLSFGGLGSLGGGGTSGGWSNPGRDEQGISSGYGGLGGLMFDPSSLGGLGFGGLGFGSSSFTGSLSTPLYDSSRFGGLPGGGRSFSSWDFDNLSFGGPGFRAHMPSPDSPFPNQGSWINSGFRAQMPTQLAPFLPRSWLTAPLPAPGSRKSTDDGAVKLSGPDWVHKFQGSTSLNALNSPFQQWVASFIAALEAAGAIVTIAATYRPAERAYLMHYAWEIARKGLDPTLVPPMEGVPINWVHLDANGQPDLRASHAAAREMVAAYGMRDAAALNTNHYQRNAIDMKITWTGDLVIIDGNGKQVTINSGPRNGGANSALWAVGASYGVIKLVKEPPDPPHWSANGK